MHRTIPPGHCGNRRAADLSGQAAHVVIRLLATRVQDGEILKRLQSLLLVGGGTALSMASTVHSTPPVQA